MQDAETGLNSSDLVDAPAVQDMVDIVKYLETCADAEIKVTYNAITGEFSYQK
jgi:hypothetical protein